MCLGTVGEERLTVLLVAVKGGAGIHLADDSLSSSCPASACPFSCMYVCGQAIVYKLKPVS